MKRVILTVFAALALLFVVLIFQPLRISAIRPKPAKPVSYPFEQAEQLAQALLSNFMVSIEADYSDYGFHNIEELKRATLGEPYIGYTFDPYIMAAADYNRAGFRDQLDGGRAIIFPILVDGEARTVITIDYDGNKLELGSFGGFQPWTIVALQKQLADQGITARVDLVSFITYDMLAPTFGMIDYKNQIWLIPLSDEGKNFSELDTSGQRWYTLAEILPVIHEKAKSVIEESDRRREELSKPPTPFVDPNDVAPTISIPPDFPEPPTPKVQLSVTVAPAP